MSKWRSNSQACFHCEPLDIKCASFISNQKRVAKHLFAARFLIPFGRVTGLNERPYFRTILSTLVFPRDISTSRCSFFDSRLSVFSLSVAIVEFPFQHAYKLRFMPGLPYRQPEWRGS